MYMRNSNGASSCKTDFFRKLAKVNFPTETVILFLLKYLIFKMNKINSLSFKLKNRTKIIKHKTTKTDHAKKLYE